MRTVLLGLLGLVLAVAVGLGVHLVTRSTIALPVVQLEPAPAFAPPAATTTDETTTDRSRRNGRPTRRADRAGTRCLDRRDRDGRRQLRPRAGRGRSGGDSGGNSGSGGGDD